MNIVELTGPDLKSFLTACRQIANIADNGCWSLLVAIDYTDRAVKLKVNGGTWSPPLGVMV